MELDETASQQDEYLFDTIKYTIFVNKKEFEYKAENYKTGSKKPRGK